MLILATSVLLPGFDLTRNSIVPAAYPCRHLP